MVSIVFNTYNIYVIRWFQETSWESPFAVVSKSAGLQHRR